MPAGRETRGVLEAGCLFPLALEKLIDWLRAAPGPVGFVLRSVGQPLCPRPPGLADAAVFPLPLVAVAARSRKWSAQRAWASAWLSNLWVAFLNVAYAEQGQPHVCCLEPSAAQLRCITSLRRRSDAFMAELSPEVVGRDSKNSRISQDEDA